MNIDRAVMVFAGTLSLAGFVLAVAIDPWWILLSIFVGIMLIAAPLTGFCPMAWAMKYVGLRPGAAFFEEKKEK